MRPSDTYGRGVRILAEGHNLIALPLAPLLQVILPVGFRHNAFVVREGVPVDGLAYLLDQCAVRDALRRSQNQ
jgi:hypothetical protein